MDVAGERKSPAHGLTPSPTRAAGAARSRCELRSGATPGRLVRQLATASALLAVASGAAGVLVAFVGCAHSARWRRRWRGSIWSREPRLPRLDEVSLDAIGRIDEVALSDARETAQTRRAQAALGQDIVDAR